MRALGYVVRGDGDAAAWKASCRRDRVPLALGWFRRDGSSTTLIVRWPGIAVSLAVLAAAEWFALGWLLGPRC
ncbi:MAG TPA: hypothetical protein VFQ42_22435 [Mycobacterium sp.]|nr:hypothetical protein [Mycobacterium sp.]